MRDSYSLRVSRLLQRLVRNLHIKAQSMAVRRRLCLSECRVLFLLRRGKPTEMNEVRNSLQITGAFATDIADRLVKHGLVLRSKSGQDRRKVILMLTGAGQKCLEELEAERDKFFVCLFAKMEAKDREVIEAGILRLLASLESIKEG